MRDMDAVSAYAVPKGDVSGSYNTKVDVDPGARQMPTPSPTPTPLPDLLSLALVGKDDGSLHPNSLKLVLVLVLVLILRNITRIIRV